MMKRFVGYMVLFTAVVMTCQTARGVPVEWGSPVASQTDTFTNVLTVTDIADIKSEVYQVQSGPRQGEYVFTYQVSNISSVGLSFFSVLLNGGTAKDVDKDESVGDVEAISWHIVNSSETVNASFERLIQNGEQSGLLWFFSEDGSYTTGDGALFGTKSKSPVFGEGDLYVPVPEPATIVLFGASGLAFLRVRKRVS